MMMAGSNMGCMGVKLRVPNFPYDHIIGCPCSVCIVGRAIWGT